MDEQHLVALAPDAFLSGSDYAGAALCDCELTERHFDGIGLEDSLLSKVRGLKILWSNLRLSKVIVRDCDFANGIWEKAHGVSLELSKCRLTGWNVADGVFRNATFLGCKINLAVFHNAALTDCTFQRCDLSEADFQGAKLRNVTFRRCDLRNARFVAAALGNVDFRGSQLTGIHLDVHRLSGNRFDPSQLLDIARMLGLDIQDLDHGE